MSRRRKRLPEGSFPAEIVRLSHEGRGIAYVEGKTTFIDFALPGEQVDFTYTGRKAAYDEGQAVAINREAEVRRRAGCDVYGICGGCSFQHASPAYQLAHKQAVLAEQFQHFGGIQPEQWLEPLASAHQWGYRTKARLGVRHVPKKEKVLVGFRERNGRYITNMSQCPVLHPAIGNNLQALQDLLVTLEAKASIPQFEVAVADNAVALVMRHLQPLSSGDREKLRTFASEHGFRFYLQPKGIDSIHLLWPEYPVAQQPLLQYHLNRYHLTLEFFPTDFTQVNSAVNAGMVERAIHYLDPEPCDHVLDLFCGLGNFSLPLACYAGKVTGVEGEKRMVARAQGNAALNNLDNTAFYTADLFQPPGNQAWGTERYDKILIDPPRAGAEAVMHHIDHFAADKIVYISCNPATLARDAGILVKQKGYQLRYAGIMDMFPHTAHVESIAVFERPEAPV